MKKNLEKIFASASIVVALILVMVLIVTAFGGISTEEFESQLVRGLLITLAVLYLVLSVTALVLMFVSDDVVKEITLRSEQDGSVRVTVGVVNKMVRKACNEVEGVKCQKVALVTDEYGVRLKVNVKIVDKDVLQTETYLRTLFEDVFMGEFAFKFHTIEFKVTALAPKYKADPALIEQKVAQRLEQLKSEEGKQEGEVKEEEPLQEPAHEEATQEEQEPVLEVEDEVDDEVLPDDGEQLAESVEEQPLAEDADAADEE